MCCLEQRFYTEVRKDRQESLSNPLEVTQYDYRNRKESIRNSNILLCTIHMQIYSEINRESYITMKTMISLK